MKKHSVLSIAICISMYGAALIAGHTASHAKATETSKKEAKNLLLADFQQLHKNLHHKTTTYTKRYASPQELAELANLNRISNDLVLLMSVSGILTNSVNPEKANLLLLTAAEKNNITGIKAALTLGADVNIQNNQGQTAAMLAAYHGNLPMLQLLKEAGTNMRLMDDNGHTAGTYYQMNLQRMP